VIRSTTFRRSAIAFLIAAGTAVSLPAAAAAHIQVTPGLVAPNDPVKFTVTVPGESDAETTKVELKMPSNLLPFSYAETPGWKRKLVTASNGAVDRVVWTGRIPKDGFVEFSFLAGTPEKPGELVFKALQTYSDGKVVRWIGGPKSNEPAPVVQVQKGAPRQNAGGEGAADPTGGSANGSSTPVATATAVAASTDANASGGSDNSRDPLALSLGGAGLLLGLIAIVISVRTARQPSRR
jgi:uncharacterized protein YcnI